jgi:cytochrome c
MNNSSSVPIPNDLTLPLPLSREVLQVLVVLLFLLHIFFVNLMVGGSILTFLYEMLGLSRPKYDRLARQIAQTITVNKSLAVVLGIGPLLVMNLLYTVYFYAANALTGIAWLMVLPLTTAAFLLTYAHKYSWDKLASHKSLHLAMAGFSLILFLSIPFIFLTDANLMLFPERWKDIHGFFSAMFLPNVLPRYFHFVLSCLAATGLFLAGYFSRKQFPVEEKLPDFTRPHLCRIFYKLALIASAFQFLAGPLLYFTLPSRGVTEQVTGTILIGVAFALVAIGFLVKEVLSNDDTIGRFYPLIVAALSITVLAMGSGRHFYREASLAEHRKLVAEKTQQYEKMVKTAQEEAAKTAAIASAQAKADPRIAGKTVYESICIACHQAGGQGVAGAFPPLAGSEWVNAQKPERLVRIVLNGLQGSLQVKGALFPGMVPMPAQKDNLTDEKIASVLTYIRSEWGNQGDPVKVQDVARIRNETTDHSKPWTESELDQVTGQ